MNKLNLVKIVPNKNFICPKCKHLISNARQTHDCGCQYCGECLEQIVGLNCIECGKKFETNV